MIARPDIAIGLVPVTDGTIAVINLESARLQSWSRFWRAPEQPGIAEIVVERELLTAQFCGDQGALDRLETLVSQLVRGNPEAAQTSLVAAHVACATHRFAEARINLAQAMATRGVSADAAERLSLGLDQATGMDLERVLAARRTRAARQDCWGELVPLGTLLADLREFDEAEWTYHRALREYHDASPFAPAWACFELGVLWGERVSTPRLDHAAHWYGRAIEYLPCYVKARVHLAEILLRRGQTEAAGNLLRPAIASGDPEVYWRLAEVAEAAANSADAETFMEAARSGFEFLLARHRLAFVDHGAEFYLARGSNPTRAFELAQLNLANRPTQRAFELALKAARAADETRIAAELIADARQRWASSRFFRNSPLAAQVDVGTNAHKQLCKAPASGDEHKEPGHART